MHVEVGPVASSSAQAWISYARDVLLTGDQRAGLADDLRAGFEGYLDQWLKVADAGPVFRWETDVPAELVEYLVHGFYRIAEQLADEAARSGTRLRPPEGDPFYAALVHGLLDGLSSEPGPTAEFAEHLRAFWPGLDEADPT